MDGYPEYPTHAGTQYPQQPYPQRTASPPGQGGRGWIAAVVLGIVGITMIGGLVAGYLGYSAYRRGQVREQAAATEAHLAKVPARLTVVRQKLATVKFDQTDAANKTIESARTELDAIAQELSAAQDDAGRIGDEALAAAYAKTVAQAAVGVKAGRTLVQTTQTLTGLEKRTAEGAKACNEGTALVDQAINLGNKGKYSDQAAKAVAADTRFSAAQQLFQDAARLDPKSGAAGAAAWMAKAHELTSMIRLQAIDGIEGRIGEYNKKVPQVNALAAQLNALEMPAVIEDPHFGEDRVQKLANEMAAATAGSGKALQDARSQVEGDR